MPAMDPFEGAKSEGQDQKRQLLDAIATGGAAGRAEYEKAQQQADIQRQGALDWAAKRAQLTGQDLGGAPTAPVTESADRYKTYFTGQNAAFQNNLNNIGASAESYLAKIGAITPFVQAQNNQQASDRENQLKMAIAQNQAKIDADKAARLQQQQFELEKMAKANQYDIAAADRASAKATAKAGQDAIDKITPKQLIGMANQQPNIMKDSGNILASVKGQNAIAAGNLANRASTIGSQGGVPGSTLAELKTPDFLHNLATDLSGMEGGTPGIPPPPQPFDKNWLMQNVIMPGTTKKVTDSRANDVLKAPEVQQAVEIASDMANAKVGPNGRLIPGPLVDDSFSGKTRREAFDAIIDSLPGIATMKAALKQYYGPYLDGIK